MIETIERYLVGVPTDKKQQALTSMLQGFWMQHRERLTVLADKANPLGVDALEDLNEWKQLGQAVVDAEYLATNTVGYGYAKMLASLNVPTALVTFKYAAKSRRINTVMTAQK